MRAPRRRYHGAVRSRRVVARFGASPDGPPGAVAASVVPVAWRLVVTHWALLVVCALFLLVGALVLDDYGITVDEEAQRKIGHAALDHFAGRGERAFERLSRFTDRHYGAVFEVPLALIERIPGLDDSRDIYLSRHFLTHLFFLAGGVFCYLLVHRLFGNRLLALAALVLFLLHPRLYAHSFVNSKDVPFAAMFMVSLYLTHRAFRRDTLAAFLLCGAGIGLLVNLRIMGIVLFAGVLALRALDLLFVGNAGERKRVLLTGGGFALIAALTYYGSLPVLWADPGEFLGVIETGASHPYPGDNLFRGEWLYARDGPPFDYIPVWIGITSPPVVLLFATAGATWLLWRVARGPRAVRRETFPRFGVLLLALFVAPIVGIVVNGSNIYTGWRQVFFLYDPLVLLAVFGLYGLLSPLGMRWMRTGGIVLVGTSVAVMVVSMVRIHPLQAIYFNVLVDRSTPDHLFSRYDTDYWNAAYWKLLREVVADHSGQDITTGSLIMHRQKQLLPERERNRIKNPSLLFSNDFHSNKPVSNRIYRARLYNNTILSLRGRNTGDVDIGEIVRLALSGEPVARSFFTIWLRETTVVFAREDCSHEQIFGNFPFFQFHVYPVDTSVLSGRDKLAGFETIAMQPGMDAIDASGRCAWVVLLPDYPIASIVTGQYGTGDRLWGVRFGVTLPEVDPAVLAGGPVASSAFDVYRDGDELVYVRERCTDEYLEARFALDVYPHDPSILHPDYQRGRFDIRSFSFWDHGTRVGDRCIAVAPLPDYPIAGVRTGQVDGTGWRWNVEFAVTPADVDPAVLAREPLARAVFDVHRDGGAFVYVREGCTEDEARVAFFLHVVPVDADDLPAHRVEHGFDNLDFFLWQRGGSAGGRCVAAVPLPDYPIASIHTGQYDDTGQLWAVEFALPEGE